MKKTLVMAMISAVMLSMAGCGNNAQPAADTAETAATDAAADAAEEAGTEAAEAESTEEAAEADAADEAKSDGVMTYEEYLAADIDSEVTVETYIQAKQGWWEDNGQGVATFYTQDAEGGYFIYNMPCSEEDYNDKLTVGAKIKVTGYKAEWSGEVEIMDATYEVEDGTYVAEPLDVTDSLGSDDLEKYMNQSIAMKGLKVEASKDANGEDAAFLYNYDGSGTEGDDLYFNVSANGATYTFTVESYLCGKDTDVYKAVENLNIGDTIDIEGFLYWYEGAQPHVTSVTVE